MSIPEPPQLNTDDSSIAIIDSGPPADMSLDSNCANLMFAAPLDENCDQLTLSGDCGEAPESVLLYARDALSEMPASSDRSEFPTLISKEKRRFALSSESRHIHLEVWRLAWPSVITMLMQT